MFLITWIEGEEVNYRLVRQQDLEQFNSMGQNLIVQNLSML